MDKFLNKYKTYIVCTAEKNIEKYCPGLPKWARSQVCPCGSDPRPAQVGQLDLMQVCPDGLDIWYVQVGQISGLTNLARSSQTSPSGPESQAQVAK